MWGAGDVAHRGPQPPVEGLWAAVRDVAGAHVAELDELAAAYLGDRSTLDASS